MTIITIKQINWNFFNESKPSHLGTLKTKAYMIKRRENRLYIQTSLSMYYFNSRILVFDVYTPLVHLFWCKLWKTLTFVASKVCTVLFQSCKNTVGICFQLYFGIPVCMLSRPGFGWHPEAFHVHSQSTLFQHKSHFFHPKCLN